VFPYLLKKGGIYGGIKQCIEKRCPQMKLKDSECKNAKGKAKTYKLGDGKGLYLEVTPKGAKYWRLKYRMDDKEKRLSIGVYPAITLKEARQAMLEAKELIALGIDPSLDKQKKKALSKTSNANTFEAVGREWFENRKPRWTDNYAKNVIDRLEKDIFPYLGAYPISEIDAPFILSVIRKIENRGAVEVAKRQLQKCGEIFQYAIATGKIKQDPTYSLTKALQPIKKEHYNAITFDELPELLQDIERNDARLYKTTQNALWLMMLTFVRTSELINAEWDEIDLDKALWRIPAHRMKMKQPHDVPLSRQAIKILKDQKQIAGDWKHVFPSVVRPMQAMSNNTILGALKRLGYLGRMTGHGFRALAMSTIKERLNYRHEVVDKQLAHKQKSQIDQAYDRALYMEERTIMMQEYADLIDNVSSAVQNKGDV